MNTNIKKLTRQQKIPRKNKLSWKKIADNLNQLDLISIRLYNLICSMDNLYLKVAPSHEWLAQQLGISVATIKRKIEELKELELLDTHFKYMDTLIYYISSALREIDIRNKLVHLLPALAFIPLWFLYPGRKLNDFEKHIIAKEDCELLLNINNTDQRHFLSTENHFDSSIAKKIAFSEKDIIPRATPLLSEEQFLALFSFKSEASEQTNTHTNESFPKKGDIMNDNPIKQSILNCSKLHLTRWGQIKLMCFPDAAIDYGYQTLLARKNIKEPFLYMTKLCYDYCREHNLQVNNLIVAVLATKYNMPDNPMLVAPPAINEASKREASNNEEENRLQQQFQQNAKMRRDLDGVYQKEYGWTDEKTQAHFKRYYPICREDFPTPTEITHELEQNRIKRQNPTYAASRLKMMQLMGTDDFLRSERIFMPITLDDMELNKQEELKNAEYRLQALKSVVGN